MAEQISPSPKVDGAETPVAKEGSSLNILIVENDEATQALIKGHVQQLGENNILCAKTAGEAADIIANNIKRDRCRIHILLTNFHLEQEKDGADLIELVSNDASSPYAVVMADENNINSDVFSTCVNHANSVLQLGANIPYSQKLGEIIEKAKKWISTQKKAAPEEKASATVQEGALATEGATAEPEDIPEIESSEEPLPRTKEGKKFYYEKVQELRDLAKPGNYPDGTKVALLDVDGTLVEPYIMGRFVRRLENFLPQLWHDLTASQRKKSRHSLTKLLDLVKQIEGGTYRKSNEEMLEDLGRLYMETLVGLSAEKVCAIGAEWSKEDSEKRQYKFARPLMDMLKHLGIVPTLVTGMPAETLPGYINNLGGIEARCYPFELDTEKNAQGALVYAEGIKRKAGLPKVKEEIAKTIANNRHEILCVFGDQKADAGMMRVGIEKKRGISHGKAFYLINSHLSESVQHNEGLRDALSDPLDHGHVERVDKKGEPFAVLYRVVQQLFWMERFFQYGKDANGNVIGDKVQPQDRLFHDRLHKLAFHPMEVKQFIPKE